MNLQYFIPNTFKQYLYEVPNSYHKFVYSQYPLTIRADRYDEGYDDITRIRPLSSLSEKAQLRLLPFCSSISEETFIENLNDINYQDCFLTQSWGRDPSNRIQLLQRLNEKEDTEKITEKYFTNNFLHWFFTRHKDRLTIDDVVSFGIKIIYNYSRYENDIELVVENIKFKPELDAQEILKDDVKYQLISVKETAEYYFDVSSSTPVEYFLDMPILISPAMIFDYLLLEKIKDKIVSVEYDVVGDRW